MEVHAIILGLPFEEPTTASASQHREQAKSVHLFVVWHSVALGAIVGIIVMLYAYVFSGAVPHGLTFVK
jgi:hypothetical protein